MGNECTLGEVKDRSVLGKMHFSKPLLSPLRSLRVRNEVDLVPLALEDGEAVVKHIYYYKQQILKSFKLFYRK